MKRKYGVFSGLSRKLLLTFLSVALIPLIVSGYFAYNVVMENSKKDIERDLEELYELQADSIERYFNNIFRNLKLESERTGNIEFLKKLSSEFQDSNSKLKNFVKSTTYVNIEEKYGQNLQLLKKLYNYYDILIIDVKGNVLFTAIKEGDFGKNFFTDISLKNTKFTETLRNNIDSKKGFIVDYENYSISNNKKYFFFGDAINNTNGEQIGFLVFQVTRNQLSKITNSVGNENIFIVGNDFKLRTILHGKNSEEINKIRTAPVLHWLESEKLRHSQDKTERESVDVFEDTFKREYFNHENIPVIGKYHSILDIGLYDIHWSLILEIPKDKTSINLLKNLFLYILFFTIIGVILISLFVTYKIVSPIKFLSKWGNDIYSGKYFVPEFKILNNEIGSLFSTFASTVQKLSSNEKIQQDENWLKKGISEINNVMQGKILIAELSTAIIENLAKYLDAQIGTFYYLDGKELKLSGSFAVSSNAILNKLDMGEGLIGQVALSKELKVVVNLPEDYMKVNSSFGETSIKTLFIVPLMGGNNLKGVMELGFIRNKITNGESLLSQISESIAMAVDVAIKSEETKSLLKKSQRQGEELKSQQEELEAYNKELKVSEEELKSQTEELRVSNESLKVSEEELKSQAEELRIANEDLNAKAEALTEQKKSVETAKRELEIKSEDLSRASKYKSEFLANMSHELRTPLNSLLLLSYGLSKNKKGNLTSDQLEDLRFIHEGGTDLLHLINDIMDLSKVEAGKLTIQSEEVVLLDICNTMEKIFAVVAKNKGLEFNFSLENSVPKKIISDLQRLEQILKNILSNAFKFTEKGKVELKITLPEKTKQFYQSSLKAQNTIAFSVHDSGIGISKDKQKEVFEAFQQEDGSTNRKYGGTGLGLTISRELSQLLGGEIDLESTQGKGSVFTLYLPISEEPVIQKEEIGTLKKETLVKEKQTDLKIGLKENFIQDGIEKLKTTKDAVLTVNNDIRTVLPENENMVSGEIKKALIIEDSLVSQATIKKFFENKKIITEGVATGKAALEKIKKEEFNFIVLDIGLPDMSGFELLDILDSDSSIDMPQIIVYTGKELTEFERKNLQKYSATIVSKGDESPEKLLDEALLFMHTFNRELVKNQKKTIYNLDDESKLLKDRKVLLVDDDIRNTFALARLLQDTGLQVIEADNGQTALDKLEKTDGIEIVLMDMMMPVMDGYEAMKKIREMEKYKDLPILALTAKAMREDRNRCIKAGASDYLTKPIDYNKLLSMLKVWLFKK